MWIKILVQIAGQLLVATLAYQWLSIGVGSAMQLGLNAAVALALVLGWAALDAYGLGNLKHTLYAIPAVLIMGLLFWKLSAGIVVVLLLLIVLLPSAARAKWSIHATPRYLGMGIALIALTALPALALINWVPKYEGLGVELSSFFLRWGLAAVIAFGGWAILLDFVRKESLPSAAEPSIPLG
jgi:hypothetical protein